MVNLVALVMDTAIDDDCVGDTGLIGMDTVKNGDCDAGAFEAGWRSVDSGCWLRW